MLAKPKLVKNNVLYPDLSYKITGFCLGVKKELGRFAKEKQYSDRLEKKLIENNVRYSREFTVKGTGNRSDFIVEDVVLLEIKAVPFITKEDYFQTQRYLNILKLKLGMVINFQAHYLKPYRVINYELKSAEQ